MPLIFRRRTFLRGLALSAVALPALLTAQSVNAADAPASFPVEGAVTKPHEWTADQISKEFAADVKTVDYTLKGTKAQAHCVPLITVLKAAGPKGNPSVKNHLLAFTVLVRGRDGYTVAFSLAEMMPEFGKRDVWIALDKDGKPLTGEDGPVSLLVPGDDKAGRWVHSVAHIEVVDEIQAGEKK